MIPDHVSREYFHNHQNNEKLYNYRTAGPKNAKIKREQSIKLFDSSQSNNFIFWKRLSIISNTKMPNLTN
jgi:hypothetical protein